MDLNKEGIYTSGSGADDKESEKETLIAPKKKVEVEPDWIKCVIYDTYKPPGFKKQAAKCGHHLCPRCINDYVLGKILKDFNPSISCPKKECTETFSDDEIYAYLFPEIRCKWLAAVLGYHGKKEEMEAKFSALPSGAQKCLSMLDDIQ